MGNKTTIRTQKWQDSNVDKIMLKIRKDENIKPLIQAAAAKANKSKNQYMVDAIKAALERDGIELMTNGGDE